MRRAARVDDNQSAIVKKLRAIGCTVAITSSAGSGFPDIVVGYRKKNYLMEIKDPAKDKNQRKLTPDQVKFHDEWRGQISVIETFDDAMKILTEELP